MCHPEGRALSVLGPFSLAPHARRAFLPPVPVNEILQPLLFRLPALHLPTPLSFHIQTFIPMIVGEIRRYLRDNSAIRVSRSVRDTAYKVLQAREKMTAASQKEPSTDEIAKHLGLPREDVVMALEAIMDPVSLFEPVYSESGDAICVMDQVSDSKNTDEVWLERISLKEAIRHLSEREKHILSLRFFEGKTQMEVAGEIGISQAQVSRLEKNAINQMRKYL
jgi:RNA polymerase sporulation-specific sigma factor